jgi:hypothetical protein
MPKESVPRVHGCGEGLLDCRVSAEDEGYGAGVGVSHGADHGEALFKREHFGVLK